VTEHPTARWTGEQIIQAFPDESGPRYLLRDRDSIYGESFENGLRQLALRKSLLHPGVLGKILSATFIGSVRRVFNVNY